MVSESGNLLKESNNLFKKNPPHPPVAKGGGGFLNAVIEKGILFLLIFTPLAFGTVQQWSIAVMEIMAFIIFGAWLLKLEAEGREPKAESGERRDCTNLFSSFSLFLLY
jgi:hypothetical protein